MRNIFNLLVDSCFGEALKSLFYVLNILLLLAC